MSEAGEDRISNLPDPILHHIHSFLEIKDGARTSVLSTRWNYIWTTVPVLDVRRHPYLLSPSSPSSSETEKLMDFVDGTLHHHNSNIDKFSLRWHTHLNESRLHSWISTVIKGNVKELKLYLYQTQPLFAPLSLFTCASLTSLELGLHCRFTFPKDISFPRPKLLKLYRFMFTDECWNEELFSNSPVLEELILELCTFCLRNFCISIPTLKTLKIQYSYGFLDCALKIHAPNLVTFIYKADAAKEYALSSFPSLVEAVVTFYSEKDGAEISRLLRAMANIKCLTVNDLALQAICSAYHTLNNLPTFHHVKKLNVSDNITTDQGLTALLKALPNLELLAFDECMDDEQEDSDEDNENDSDEDNENDSDNAEGDGDDDNEDEGDVSDVHEDTYDTEEDCWALNSGTAGCLFPHLKSVCFEQFAGNPREMRWVKLILRNAQSLEKLTIRYDSDLRFINAKSEKEVLVEIPRFPRASVGCLFEFLS